MFLVYFFVFLVQIFFFFFVNFLLYKLVFFFKSESNNYAIKGIVNSLLKTNQFTPSHPLQIITTQIEHPSVTEVFKYLEAKYSSLLEVVFLPVTSEGVVDIKTFKSLIKPNIGFMSVMHANNETGAVQPIRELAEWAKKINPEMVFHTDASQSIGKIPVDVEKLGVDLLTVCPHKFYGPKGIGALYIRSGNEKKMEKFIHGGNHEKNLRAGTENVLEIVGLGKASELVYIDLKNRINGFKDTRDIIYHRLRERLGENGFQVQGPKIETSDETTRLPNTLFLSFPRLEANLLLDLLSDKVACSCGAACHSDDVKMSHVLEAMHTPPEIAMGTLRLSTGLSLSKEQALSAAEVLADTVEAMRLQRGIDQETETCNIINDDMNVKLTKTTHGLGCGCKLSATTLSTILAGLGKQNCIIGNKEILVGTETSDDCCVYKISEEQAVVCTLDFFTPICDDPESFGAIACSNALSDIYAMGGKPLFALNIVGFPIKTLHPNVLRRVLKGAQDKAEEAGVAILGGHSIEDTEPKFGLSVTGIVNPNFIWRNSTMKHGDYILITKKLGVGTMMTALKRGVLKEEDTEYKNAVDSMKFLNRKHCEAMLEMEQNQVQIVNACTDITGFGLLGHLKEGLISTKKSATVYFDSVPFLDKTRNFIEMGVLPGGTLNNQKFVEEYCEYDIKLTNIEKCLLNDPQTSGGLMIFVGEKDIDRVRKTFEEKGLECYLIGRVEKEDKGKIIVKKGVIN